MATVPERTTTGSSRRQGTSPAATRVARRVHQASDACAVKTAGAIGVPAIETKMMPTAQAVVLVSIYPLQAQRKVAARLYCCAGKHASPARAMEGLLVAPSTATPIRTTAEDRARTHTRVAGRGGGSTSARRRWCRRSRSGIVPTAAAAGSTGSRSRSAARFAAR